MGFLKKAQPPQDMIGSTEECNKTSSPCYPNNLIVEFRPKHGYKGEYGFDWLRVDDKDISPQKNPGTNPSRFGYFEEKPYEDCILGGYNSNFFGTKASAYKALKEEYITQFTTKKRTNYTDLTYYVPYLNIFSEKTSAKFKSLYPDLSPAPPFEAELRLIFYASGDKADEVVFEFSDSFQVDGESSPYIWSNTKDYTPNAINKDGSRNIKIKCLKDIDTEEFIKVFAYYKKGSEKEKKIRVGQLCVLPNSDKFHKVLKIAFIHVETNVTGKKSQEGIFREDEIKLLNDVLYQSLVVPDITKKIKFDLTTDKNWQVKGRFIKTKGEEHEFYLTEKTCKYLRDAFLAIPENKQKYQDHFLAFALGLYNSKLYGRVLEIGTKVTVNTYTVQDAINVETTAHEILHGLGLSHTHKHIFFERLPKSAKYVYYHGHKNKKYATDNVMSYSEGWMYNTWYWQWRIIHEHI